MKYNILVIEKSSRTIRSKIATVLSREGFGVATAASPQEVVSTLDEFKPQLIILGEGLAGGSFEACSRLRQTVSIPIMMVGAVLSDRVWNQVVEVGADFYLAKPFGYLELVARVKALLRRQEWTRGKKQGRKQ